MADNSENIDIYMQEIANTPVLSREEEIELFQRLENGNEAARKEIETMLGAKVFLKLFVRVQKNWTKDTKALRKFGY